MSGGNILGQLVNAGTSIANTAINANMYKSMAKSRGCPGCVPPFGPQLGWGQRFPQNGLFGGNPLSDLAFNRQKERYDLAIGNLPGYAQDKMNQARDLAMLRPPGFLGI